MYDKRTPIDFHFEQKPHILIVKSSFHHDITTLLQRGAENELKKAQVTYEIIDVPGALEIATAIVYAVKGLDFDAVRRRFDGYVALGCVLKGETIHDEVVAYESTRGLQDVAMQYTLAVGYGILTCNTREQALKRANPDGFDRGGAAAEACLRMVELKHIYRLSAKRRWIGR